MQLADFYIGLEFLGPAGFRFRCTDVGQRTILAIRLHEDDPRWYEGPPYALAEEVFDEVALGRCHLTEGEALREAVMAAEASAHPGFSGEVVKAMMARLYAEDHKAYPRKGLFRFDRVRPDGSVLHPYSAQREGEAWRILCYSLFDGEFTVVPESVFLGWKRTDVGDDLVGQTITASSV